MRQVRKEFLLSLILSSRTMSGAAVFIFSAVMAAAGMVVVMTMMIALYIGIKGQIAGQISLDGIIRRSGHSAEKLNSGFCQSSLGPSADSAADEHLHTLRRKEAG